MQNSYGSHHPVWLAGAALLLAAAPHIVSAQAVGAFLQPGGATQQRSTAPVTPSRTGPSSPSRSAQPTPSQTGQFSGRPANPLPVPPSSAPASPGQMTWTQHRSGGSRNGPSQNNGGQGWSNFGNNSANNSGYIGNSNDRMNTPVGPGNGFWSSPTPPVGPANGFWSSPIPPVGPANGYSSSSNLRVNTPFGSQDVQRDSYRDNYIYSRATDSLPIAVGGPPLLGGYYYGGYCNQAYSTYTYPSVYSVYFGLPQFLCSPNVIVASQPYLPAYVSPPVTFYQPLYSVTYNNNYYYVTNESKAHDLEAGGEPAQEALRDAYPADSYQAAFGDIARAWLTGDIKPFEKHLRDSDTRLSVFLNTKYSYSIASGDFVQITRDAMDRLNTVSFEFTQLRKAKNGDVTAFGKHVYTAPPDPSAPDAGSSSGEKKTVYVSYTLSQRNNQWVIIAVDSSENDLAANH